MFYGPGTYTPKVEAQVVEVVKAIIVNENSALKLRARQAFSDRANVRHEAGEEWLFRDTGAFLPDVHEEVLGVVHAHVLTDKKALHLKALAAFTDAFKVKRQAGEEWLVTMAQVCCSILFVAIIFFFFFVLEKLISRTIIGANTYSRCLRESGWRSVDHDVDQSSVLRDLRSGAQRRAGARREGAARRRGIVLPQPGRASRARHSIGHCFGRGGGIVAHRIRRLCRWQGNTTTQSTTTLSHQPHPFTLFFFF
jgi:hypothetical protein